MAFRGRPAGKFESENTSDIGYLLGTSRSNLGLSLKTVAARIGVSVQYVSNIEHGRAPLPAKYVADLADLLQLDPAQLVATAVQDTATFRQFKTVANNINN